MSDMKRTPGPWTVGSHGEIWSCDGNVCDAWVHEGLTSELPRDANAHLIAAAPELYEALYRLTADCITDGLEEKAGYDCWIHHAKVALAKARGETK